MPKPMNREFLDRLMQKHYPQEYKRILAEAQTDFLPKEKTVKKGGNRRDSRSGKSAQGAARK